MSREKAGNHNKMPHHPAAKHRELMLHPNE
jgi:hypothetical protein